MGPTKGPRDPAGQAKAGIVSALDLGDPTLAAVGGKGYLFLAQLKFFATLAYHFPEGDLRV